MTRNRMDHHQWDSALDPQVAPLFLALQWAHARSIEAMRPVLAKHGLSAGEFDVLATLRNTSPPYEATPACIQEQMVITSGGLTKLLHQLEERELVTRLQVKDDLRVKPARLTSQGRRLIEVAMAQSIAVTGAWVRKALDAAEIEQLSILLNRLVAEPDH